MAVEIVQCTSIENQSWRELRVALWPHCSSEEHLEEMKLLIASPDRYAQFVAFASNGRAVGFVEVSVRSDYVNGTESSPAGFLEGVYVVPDFRGGGIARALILEAGTWVKAAGCHEIASDTSIDNHGSRAMHCALGFTETERVIYFRKVLQ